MADNNNITQDTPVGGEPEVNTQPQAGMLAQYVKDFSFENPNAPASLQARPGNSPKIDVSINVGVRQAQNDVFEVELKIKTTGTVADQNNNDMVAFVAELNYAGLFGVRNLTEDSVKAFLLVSAPTLMFPYARRVISDATRDGGFPPLMLEPINFQALYMQQQAQEQAAGTDTASADGASVSENITVN